MNLLLRADSHCIGGINYYKTPEEALASFKEAPLIRRVYSHIDSYKNLALQAVFKASITFFQKERLTDSLIEPPKKGYWKKRLVVCVHGLNTNPAQFEQFLRAVSTKEYTDTQIFIPRVRQAGHAKLDDLTAPIFKEIARWAKRKGDRQLVLIGISNGARIIKNVYAKLVRSGNLGNINSVRFISIVGACNGSQLANIAKKVGAHCMMSPHIAKELPTDSERVELLNRHWDSAMKEPVPFSPEFIFIGAPHDWLVPNTDSSLMEVPGKTCLYAYVANHGHCSVLAPIATSLAKLALSDF